MVTSKPNRAAAITTPTVNSDPRPMREGEDGRRMARIAAENKGSGMNPAIPEPKHLDGRGARCGVCSVFASAVDLALRQRLPQLGGTCLTVFNAGPPPLPRWCRSSLPTGSTMGFQAMAQDFVLGEQKP
jgi:hypothetical protein